MKSRLLKSNDYRELTKLRSVEEVAHRLKEFPAYKEIMKDLTDTELHRNFLESKLLLSIAQDFSRINKFVTDINLRMYLNALALRNEIHVLKFILNMAYDKRNIQYSDAELKLLIGNKLKIDIAMLKTAKTVTEVIDALRGTSFYNLLLDTFENTGSLFELEMKLDLYYYMNLWKLHACLNKTNEAEMKRLNGTEIDFVNLDWLYRFKKYYKFDASSVYSYLVPIKHKLNADDFNRITKSNTFSEFTSALLNTYYGNLFEHDNIDIERAYYNQMFKLYNSISKNNNSLAKTVAYIYFKQREIKNITSLIEGVRYGLEPKDIMQYLFIGGV